MVDDSIGNRSIHKIQNTYISMTKNNIVIGLCKITTYISMKTRYIVVFEVLTNLFINILDILRF